MLLETLKQHSGLSDRDLETLFSILKKYNSVSTVFVFGSRAKGTFKKGSDIDLAIMNDGVLEDTVRNIRNDLEDSSLPYLIDMVNYPILESEELKRHIDRVGIPFYERNPPRPLKS